MSATLVVVMDPIETIHPRKDTTLALLLEAQRRGYRLLYATQQALAIRDGAAWGRLAPLQVRDDDQDWFTLAPARWQPLAGIDVALARKDPPVDAQFVYDTMVLELAQAAGVTVINDPRGLRDANEKLFALRFPSAARRPWSRAMPASCAASSPNRARWCSSRSTAWVGAASSARAMAIPTLT